MKNKIEELLNKKAKSPIPHLKADPFLITRIEELSKKEGHRKSALPPFNWSLASILAVVAVFTGIYLGNNLFGNSAQENDFISEYSNAIYQSDFGDNLLAVELDEGESDEE